MDVTALLVGVRPEQFTPTELPVQFGHVRVEKHQRVRTMPNGTGTPLSSQTVSPDVFSTVQSSPT